jgi:hypothetical protein
MPDLVPDRVTQPLYDSGLVATTLTTKITFFSQPIGTGTTSFGAGVKTLTDTNLVLQSQIPAGWRHECKAISLVGWSVAATQMIDLQTALQGSFIQVKTGGNKIWLELPAKRLTGGCGVEGVAATAVGGSPLTIQSAHNGVGDPRAVYGLLDPIVIIGGTAFVATMEWPGGSPVLTAVMAMTLFFEGITWRLS